jgi:hypothetical protein
MIIPFPVGGKKLVFLFMYAETIYLRITSPTEKWMKKRIKYK